MGEVRYKEMLNVAETLNLTEMVVLDLPDSGLKEMDPKDIEKTIADEIKRVQPHVVVSYPVHGISGFHDHLVAHAVVKRVFLESKKEIPALQRLAFQTITLEEAAKSPHFHLNGSTADEIDCIVKVEPIDVKKNIEALDCYETFKETIEKTGIKHFVEGDVFFEIFQEAFDPPLSDLCAGLVDSPKECGELNT